MAKVVFTEEMALDYCPFFDDFGEQADRKLRDKIVTIKKERPCSTCGSTCRKGTKCRSMVYIFDGEVQAYTYCNDCTLDQAKFQYDEEHDDIED